MFSFPGGVGEDFLIPSNECTFCLSFAMILNVWFMTVPQIRQEVYKHSLLGLVLDLLNQNFCCWCWTWSESLWCLPSRHNGENTGKDLKQDRCGRTSLAKDVTSVGGESFIAGGETGKRHLKQSKSEDQEETVALSERMLSKEWV